MARNTGYVIGQLQIRDEVVMQERLKSMQAPKCDSPCIERVDRYKWYLDKWGEGNGTRGPKVPVDW